MCGIIGILGRGPVADQLVESLKRLEYRGYDSAGVATLEDGQLTRRRAEGKLKNLAARLRSEPLYGMSGIGHTRWATHGRPNETNAHPHATEDVSGVHNGTIENHREIREALLKRGRLLESETDSELVVHLVQEEIDKGCTPEEAVANVAPMLKGAYALLFLFATEDDLLIGVQNGPPLAVGFSPDGTVTLGSDAVALADIANEIMYLEPGDMAIARRGNVEVRKTASGEKVNRMRQKIDPAAAKADKGLHPYFMGAEIHSQPTALQRTLARYFDLVTGTVTPVSVDVKSINVVYVIGCGTSEFAGQASQLWFARYSKMTVIVMDASEFRYSERPLRCGDLAVFISQSGETADTLAALRLAKAAGLQIVSILNVPTSTIARESEVVLEMLVGPEIGVASTKAYTAAFMILTWLALSLAKAKGELSPEVEQMAVKELSAVPRLMSAVLEQEPEIMVFARELSKFKNAFYLGRGPSHALALEGALKLKEISYCHAEGQASGQVKHGSIALIDPLMASVFIAPSDKWFEKTASNLSEVDARGGPIFLLTDALGAHEITAQTFGTLILPATTDLTSVFVYAVALQLIAYHAAMCLGEDVDHPRHLAKSVTVE
jgi:glucosamine--fructose-6-phosphate aminotransferase (isomerizing)